MQVDLTITRPRHVWIGIDDGDLNIGKWQILEYENIPHTVSTAGTKRNGKFE